MIILYINKGDKINQIDKQPIATISPNVNINNTINNINNYAILIITQKPTVQVEVNGSSSVGKTTLIQQLMTSEYLGDPSNCQGQCYVISRYLSLLCNASKRLLLSL